jgi:hypothetical protein
MELISASSPGMRSAHSHSHVHTIVYILLLERSLLKPTALFLKKFTSCEQERFEENLDALCLNQQRSDINGDVVTSDNVTTLIKNLANLYQQRDKQKIQYQRGAIVEQLVHKLIYHRYNLPSEMCQTNQKFVDNHKNITIQEVDVAALSTTRWKAEGYECKINTHGFDSYDSINLHDLAEAAQQRQYRVNVGFVAFENDRVMELKLANRQLPNCIKVYGLDSIEALQHLTTLDN